MIFKNLCLLVLRTKVASALEGFMRTLHTPRVSIYCAMCTIICTSDPDDGIIQHTDMIAFHLTSMRKN